MAVWLEDVELKGELVTLVPLNKTHRDELVKAASDGALWNLWFTFAPSEDTVDTYIEFALSEKTLGRSLAFVVINNRTKKIIGSTRFCHGEKAHRRVEIGYTWYAKSFQRTGVNTECKLLMLTHAFEVINAIAVEFRTHWHNHASRNAIARIGAKQDAILRNHMIEPDGALRDTVVFSIIEGEWPAVCKSLKYKINFYH